MAVAPLALCWGPLPMDSAGGVLLRLHVEPLLAQGMLQVLRVRQEHTDSACGGLLVFPKAFWPNNRLSMWSMHAQGLKCAGMLALIMSYSLSRRGDAEDFYLRCSFAKQV